MKARYRNTVAGFVWVTINPISLFIVHALIFKHVLKIDLPRYSLFLMGGVLPWVFATSSVNMTTGLFVTSRQILNSFKINPFILIFSTIIDNFLNFCFALFILLTIYFLGFSQDISGLGFILLLPSALLVLIVVSLLCSILALFHTFYRDTMYVVQFINSMMYFLTPIFYPVSLIPEKFRFLVNFNPYYILIQPFQICLWDFDLSRLFISLSQVSVLGIILGVILHLYWKKKHAEFYIYV